MAEGTVRVYNGNYTDLKGTPEPLKPADPGVTYRVMSPFTNWVNGKKYAKGDKVTVYEKDAKGFENALNQGKLKKV